MAIRLFECWIAVVVVSALILSLLCRNELKAVEKNFNDAYSSAGIVGIDWWWKCLRGIYLLGFTRKGGALSSRTRWIFKGFIVVYVLFVLTMVVMCALRFGVGASVL